jgi:HPt (histidine-containing phosphotransfer) domain-containing protein
MDNENLHEKLSQEIEFDIDLVELIPIYLSNIKKDYHEMGIFLEESNFEGVGKLAHKIKGSAKSYGFDYIDELMRAIEESIKEEKNH